MMQTTTDTIARVCGGTVSGVSDSTHLVDGVSIDSRSLKAGELFVAIRGEHSDGHAFVGAAIAKGAPAAIVDKNGAVGVANDAGSLIVVEDTHEALIALAMWYRDQVTDRTIGITGSSGKTTVKEMTRCLLGNSVERVAYSQGNLNNLFGLPLSILRMSQDATAGVFELGISMPGEMARLASILAPRVGVITNVSAAHTATLGSVESVRREKVTLLSHLHDSGVAVVDGDDSLLREAARRIGVKTLTFGVGDNNDFVARDISTNSASGGCEFTLNGQRVRLPLFGAHHAKNAACALAACTALGVAVDVAALESVSLGEARFRGEIESVAGMTLVIDCYNANPASTLAGLQSFLRYAPGGSSTEKIIAVGEMRELGELSEEEHAQIGIALAKELNEVAVRKAGPLSVVVTVGGDARKIGESFERAKNGSIPYTTRVIHCDSADEAGREIMALARPGVAVYFKGSRGVELERAVTIVKGGAFRTN